MLGIFIFLLLYFYKFQLLLSTIPEDALSFKVKRWIKMNILITALIVNICITLWPKTNLLSLVELEQALLSLKHNVILQGKIIGTN